MVEDFWIDNGGVKIHCLLHRVEANDSLPIVFVPGMMGSAESYQSEMKHFAERSSLAMSLRGRGQSDVPKQGYTFEDHVADVEAAIDACGWDRFYLSGYSVGVSFVVAYALRHPDKIAGLILGDSMPVYKKITARWVEGMLHYRPEFDGEMLHAMQVDSADVDLWEQLGSINCPVLVMKGDAEGSALSLDDVDKYKALLDNVDVMIFPDAGHELWKPIPDLYLRTVGDFLRKE